MIPYILCFAHADIRLFAGGLAKYIHEEAALAASRGIGLATVFPLHLEQFPRLRQWAARGWGVLRDGRWSGVFSWQDLVYLLGQWEREGWALAEIQLHHIGRCDTEDLRRFLSAVPARVRLFLHDYHTVCLSAHLMNDRMFFCGTGRPCVEKCNGCRYWNADWLPRVKAVLGGLGERLRVTAPAESVAEGWLETWPEFRKCLDVIPHWKPTRMVRGPGHPPGTPMRLAFAGAQLRHKGWDVWCRTIEALQKAGITYEYLYFGLDRKVPDGVSSVHVGAGQMTEALKRKHVDFLCLWSVIPETYSYVYFEAVQAGVWVLAPEVSGNVAAAIRKSGWGTVFRDEDAMLTFLRDEVRVRALLERAQDVERPAEMVVNSHVLDELPEVRSLNLHFGRVRRAWLHEAVWKLKEWTGHV